MLPRTVIVQIEANVIWHVARDQEAGVWIGLCQSLNLNAIGETWQELQDTANEAMQLLFKDLFETGELVAFLQQNRWPLQSELPAQGTSMTFDVPMTLQRAPMDQLVGARA